jgi:hypothetical protein
MWKTLYVVRFDSIMSGNILDLKIQSLKPNSSGAYLSNAMLGEKRDYTTSRKHAGPALRLAFKLLRRHFVLFHT